MSLITIKNACIHVHLHQRQPALGAALVKAALADAPAPKEQPAMPTAEAQELPPEIASILAAVFAPKGA